MWRAARILLPLYPTPIIELDDLGRSTKSSITTVVICIIRGYFTSNFGLPGTLKQLILFWSSLSYLTALSSVNHLSQFCFQFLFLAELLLYQGLMHLKKLRIFSGLFPLHLSILAYYFGDSVVVARLSRLDRAIVSLAT